MGTIPGTNSWFPYQNYGKFDVAWVPFDRKILPSWWDRDVEAAIRRQDPSSMASRERQTCWGEVILVRKAKSSYVLRSDTISAGKVYHGFILFHRQKGLSFETCRRKIWDSRWGQKCFHFLCGQSLHCEQNLVLGISNRCLFTMHYPFDVYFTWSIFIASDHETYFVVSEALRGSGSHCGGSWFRLEP